MNAMLVSNGLIGLCLAWIAWREFRSHNRRDAGILGSAACIALAVSAGTWLHVLEHGW
ncbi:hypothetical protein [Massilia sp. BHUDP2]|uniref:hypothetical protein n=1 Tax=Massilia sp. BHUDP2 TaxID=3034505 RepID=UPI0039066FE0